MRLEITSEADLARTAAAEILPAERAVTAGVAKAGARLKRDWRREITGAGLGQRLARTIRNRTYPEHEPSIGAAALVWSRAPEIVGAHAQGALVRSRHGFWLAIPTPAAAAAIRGRKVTPDAWERRTGMRLRFVYRRTGPSLLVADNVRITRTGRVRENVTRRRDGTTYSRLSGRASAVMFLLVPQVRLRKRLDLGRAAHAAETRLPGLIVAGWGGK